MKISFLEMLESYKNSDKRQRVFYVSARKDKIFPDFIDPNV